MLENIKELINNITVDTFENSEVLFSVLYKFDKLKNDLIVIKQLVDIFAYNHKIKTIENLNNFDEILNSLITIVSLKNVDVKFLADNDTVIKNISIKFNNINLREIGLL